MGVLNSNRPFRALHRVYGSCNFSSIRTIQQQFRLPLSHYQPSVSYMKCITPLAQILHLDSQSANDHQAPINRNGSMSPSYLEEATVTETSNLNQQSWVTMEQPQLQSAQLATRAFISRVILGHDLANNRRSTALDP